MDGAIGETATGERRAGVGPATAAALLHGTAGLLRGGASSGPVRRVAVPPAARAVATLPRVDYEDAFVLAAGRVRDRTAEEWARAMLEGASEETRRTLRCTWAALGLELGAAEDPERVLGWERRLGSPDLVLLGADGRLGLHGEVLFERRRRTLLFATFVKLDNPLTSAVWGAVAPGHRRAVRSLLERAGARDGR